MCNNALNVNTIENALFTMLGDKSRKYIIRDHNNTNNVNRKTTGKNYNFFFLFYPCSVPNLPSSFFPVPTSCLSLNRRREWSASFQGSK